MVCQWTLFYRYEVYHNCNLTEIGEPFAEQPYALAVQQGSHLQEELSGAILELQKDRRVQCKFSLLLMAAWFCCWHRGSIYSLPNDKNSMQKR